MSAYLILSILFFVALLVAIFALILARYWQREAERAQREADAYWKDYLRARSERPPDPLRKGPKDPRGPR